VSLTQL